MKPQSFHILSSEGEIQSLTIGEPLKISNDIFASISTGIVRTAKKVFDLPGVGPVNVSLPKSGAYYSVRLSVLPLRCRYSSRDGVLHPNFIATNDPVLDMQWQVPPDMKLVFVLHCEDDENGVVIFQREHWLLAFDTNSACYKLPLGNLFSDSKICLGDIEGNHDTAQGAMLECMKALQCNPWNNDGNLAGENNAEHTMKLFRFKLKNSPDGGYDQLPSAEQPWTTLAQKISPPVLNFFTP